MREKENDDNKNNNNQKRDILRGKENKHNITVLLQTETREYQHNGTIKLNRESRFNGRRDK